MNKRSCHIIKYALENSNISNFLDWIVIDDTNASGNLFYKMSIKPKDKHSHFTHHINDMAYTLSACCEQEYLDTSIKDNIVYLE